MSSFDYFGEAHGAKQSERERIMARLNEMGFEALYGKGGFWLKGHGHISFAKARKLAAVEVPDNLKRSGGKSAPWGEYAWLKAFATTKVGK